MTQCHNAKEDFMAVTAKIVYFWVATPCNLVGEHGHFKGTWSLSALKCVDSAVGMVIQAS
jgi:hypothetical protein